MAACCPAGSLGPAPLNELEPRGKATILKPLVKGSTREELPCYKVGPKNPRRIICVFSDVFGIDSGNHKAFCDILQEKLGDSTAVWMPDVFRGVPLMKQMISSFFDFFATAVYTPYLLYSINTRITARSIDHDLAEIVNPNAKKTGCEYVGCVGFCFGAWTAARALGIEDGIFSAAVGIHPSFKPECFVKLGSGKVETLIHRAHNKPLLLLPAKQDTDLRLDSKAVRQIAKRRALSIEDVCIEFPDMNHGWVTRGDSSVPAIKRNQEKAIKLVVEFFEHHFRLDEK